jgi:hypothetical protein
MNVLYPSLISYRGISKRDAPLCINWHWISDDFKNLLFGLI